MGGIHPTGILTDQCESIRIAVEEVMPNTVHRLCLWHICQKIPIKFKGVADRKSCIADFHDMINGSLSIAEFKEKWVEFLSRYNLQSNRWLRDLYAEKEKWAPVYLNHLFWAGMMSTQRSESVNAFFDGYVTSKSTLKTFVEQYERVVAAKVKLETDADAKSEIKRLKAGSQYKWEEQFACAYTFKVYELLLAEIAKISNCNVQEVASIGGDDGGHIEKFEVLELCLQRNRYHKQYTFTVEYQPVGEYISCNCRKFEYKGILCVHVLKVLVYKNIQHVNERYILRRWRMNVYRPHSSIIFAGGYPHMTDEYKAFQEVEREFQRCTDLAHNSVAKMNFIKKRCRDTQNDLMNWTDAPASSVNAPCATAEGTSAQAPLLNPNIARPRGRPRENRYRNPGERHLSARTRNNAAHGSGN